MPDDDRRDSDRREEDRRVTALEAEVRLLHMALEFGKNEQAHTVKLVEAVIGERLTTIATNQSVVNGRLTVIEECQRKDSIENERRLDKIEAQLSTTAGETSFRRWLVPIALTVANMGMGLVFFLTRR